ncbi:hypothetical protein DL89DRAFT_253779 [Linderina pennispora]|uniref:K Homology domain-containing protein n=1 Tax=Linderina pennispora TaxID=61395 RepID=A0A1Y1WJZ0_9FUNG|nr:uncharacterized protein DL89DRAFT_253779 [Linderina pennispora]ORX73859.1 hypothetical protein DL89DRAFT_253779 [Linderina pennispora]
MISLAQEQQQQQHNHSIAMAESHASSDDGHYSLSDMMLDDEGVDDATAEGSHSVKEDARRGMAMSAGDDDVPKAEQFTVRLIFPHEDGGVLIGKEGRHITKLKEATKATWLITSNNSDREDRVVILRGAVDHISQVRTSAAWPMVLYSFGVSAYSVPHIAPATPIPHTPNRGRQEAAVLREHHCHAIHELSKHLCTEARHPTNPGSLLLRYLFPFRAIGAIVGPGGSYIEELRAKPGVQRLHIYKSTIPFTQERVVEVGATPEAMQMAAQWLVDHTKSNLTQLQESSTLYKPFLAMNQRTMAAEASESTVGREDGNRKRSRSMIGLGHVDSDSKRLRRQSEEGRARSGSSPTRYSRSSRHSSTSGPKRLSTYTAHAAIKSDTKEKLVVPDRVAGRLIGRNGTFLALLQDRSGAHIELSPRIQNMSDRIVTIVGRADKVSCARRLIKDSVRDFEK